MSRVTVGEHAIEVHRGVLPAAYVDARRPPSRVEEFELESSDGEACVVAVSAAGDDRPLLVVAQRFSPAVVGVFDPGVLLVPETKVLFIGAGTRLLGYSLYGPRRLWEDTADVGFWGWRRHGNHVLMAAELELAAWEINGRKLWSTFVEPPWSYRVEGRRVLLDVMGQRSGFPLQAGPFAVPARYRPLDPEQDWPFFHPSAPVPKHAVPLIRPLTEDYCRALWWAYVSDSSKPVIGTLPAGEWPGAVFKSGRRFEWVEDWNARRSARVTLLLREHVPWPDDAVVYFLWTRSRGVETRWSVFRDHWMSFLFDDEGPLLINPERPEAVIFAPGGSMHLGSRPDLPH